MSRAYLIKDDNVALVSLSKGLVGEKFCSHQLELGKKRLKDLGLNLLPMPHSLKGIDFIASNPAKRIEDFVHAFVNPKYQLILSAIGGDDAYLTVPHLLGNKELCKQIIEHPKPYLGYSDSTINHLMLYKLGIRSFYGQAFLTEFGELEDDMLTYSKKSFLNLFSEKPYVYKPSPIWYEERTNFSPDEIGKKRIAHQENCQWLCLNGEKRFRGKLFGGCVEVLYKLAFDTERKKIVDEYNLLPLFTELKDYVIFLENSEISSALTPSELKDFLLYYKEKGLFSEARGIIVGSPQNHLYFHEYQAVYKEVFAGEDISIAFNLPFGHSYPKMILQYDAEAEIDLEKQELIMYPCPLLDEKRF